MKLIINKKDYYDINPSMNYSNFFQYIFEQEGDRNKYM